MKLSVALAGGLAGTLTSGLLHEMLKKITADAPRMELLDMEALSKVLENINVKLPEQDELLKWTLTGEIVSHLLYYSLVHIGNKKNVWLRGAGLGIAAGITAVVLPQPLGLQGAPVNRKPQTQAMTIGLYFVGGLAASAITKWLAGKEDTSY